MPPISEPATLARVTTLSAAVDAGAERVRAAREAVAEAAQRRASLARSLAEHDAAEPEADPDLTAELSALLAANPAAASSNDWTGKLREAQDATAAAVKAWQGKRTVIDQALGHVVAEHAARLRDEADAVADHERAWSDFVIETREAMTIELEQRFPAFYAEVLGPLDGLNGAQRLYGGGPVQSGPRRGVTHDSVLAIGSPRNGSIHHDVKLYPTNDRGRAAQLLAAFRQRLGEGSPRKVRPRA